MSICTLIQLFSPHPTTLPCVCVEVLGSHVHGSLSARFTPYTRMCWCACVAVFLFCWLPFFTINIINAVCIRHDACDQQTDTCSTAFCHIDPLMLSCFVWFGYINSALNPVIYTIFNAEFRQVFNRLLGTPCRSLSH